MFILSYVAAPILVFFLTCCFFKSELEEKDEKIERANERAEKTQDLADHWVEKFEELEKEQAYEKRMVKRIEGHEKLVNALHNFLINHGKLTKSPDALLTMFEIEGCNNLSYLLERMLINGKRKRK